MYWKLLGIFMCIPNLISQVSEVVPILMSKTTQVITGLTDSVNELR